MAEPTPPRVLELTPLNPIFRDDPYAMLAKLREDHPVMRDDLAGVFFISRHEDVRGILTDLTLWRDPSRAENCVDVFERSAFHGIFLAIYETRLSVPFVRNAIENIT